MNTGSIAILDIVDDDVLIELSSGSYTRRVLIGGTAGDRKYVTKYDYAFADPVFDSSGYLTGSKSPSFPSSIFAMEDNPSGDYTGSIQYVSSTTTGAQSSYTHSRSGSVTLAKDADSTTTFPSKYDYSHMGYTGSISKVGGEYTDPAHPNKIIQRYEGLVSKMIWLDEYKATYSGYITRDDTREYMYYYQYSVTIEYTLLTIRPDDWEWYTAKEVDQPLIVSSVEWNNYCHRINEFRSYKMLDPYNFTTVSKNQVISTSIVNHPIIAMKEMSPSISPPTAPISGVTNISAFFFNRLRDSLNSIR